MLSRLPRSILLARKRTSFDHVVEEGVVTSNHLKECDVSTQTVLDENSFIDILKFRRAFVEYCESYSHENLNNLKSFPVWATISAEQWLKRIIERHENEISLS